MSIRKNNYLQSFREATRQQFAVDTLNMSMSEWAEKNTKLRKRPFSFKGYEFQRQIMDDMHRNLYCIKCSQIGLALDLETPIPTQKGWTTMGGIQVGDKIFDESGNLCTVTYTSPIYTDHDCYELTFDNGETIVADANHRWYVEASKAFNDDGLYSGRGRPSTEDYKYSGVLRTEIIAQKFKSGNRNVFAIPNTKALDGVDEGILVDPYYLGVWLGDGNSVASVFTSHIDDIPEYCNELQNRGLIVKTSSMKDNSTQIGVDVVGSRRNSDTMPMRMKQLGLIHNQKFIPPSYLRASIKTRLDLLRGLLDTDGTITPRGIIEFYNTNPELLSGVYELVSSLGFKPRISWRSPGTTTLKSGHIIKSKKSVGIIRFVAYAEDDLFTLERKRSRLRRRTDGRPSESMRRRITNVVKVPSRPVRCISVDSPNRLFLAGRGMIPTHNTEIQLRKYAAFLARNTAVNGIFSLPNDVMFKRISQTRFGPLISEEEVFNMGADRPIRSVGLYQINNSFGYFTGGKESDATSINADLLLQDEIDLADQEILALYQSRLQGSDYKITQSFSTPTHEGYGVDLGYEASDQHEYVCRCTRCNHYNIPQFTPTFITIPGLSSDINDLSEIDDPMLDKLDLEGSYVRCEICSAPLDLGNPELREWVPRFAGRRTRGYRVPPFVRAELNVEHIVTMLVRYKKGNALRRWYNTVLGEAKTDSNARLSEVEVLAVMQGEADQEPDHYSPVFVGIDVGLTCHITLAHVGHGAPIVFSWRQVLAENLVDEINQILKRYNVIGGVMDRNPYTPLANEIRDLSSNRIIPVEYASDGSATVQFVNDELDNLSHARGNRTAMLDTVVEAIRKRQTTLIGYGKHQRLILDHLQDMVRIEKEDGTSARWQKLTGNDHFFHALAYVFFAMRLNNALEFRNSSSNNNTLIFASSASVSPDGDTLLGLKTHYAAPISSTVFS